MINEPSRDCQTQVVAADDYRDPVTGRFIKQGPGWGGRKKETEQLTEFKRGLLNYAPDVLALIPKLANSKSEKTQLALLRLYVEMFIPKEVVQKIWQVSLKGDVQSLQAHTQHYAEFLAWKGRKELEAQGVDVDAIDRERERDVIDRERGIATSHTEF